MNKDRYRIDPITDIKNKIWAYNLVFQKEPNTIIIPSKIYEASKMDIDSLNKNIIVCDDFKEIKCVTIKGLE